MAIQCPPEEAGIFGTCAGFAVAGCDLAAGRDVLGALGGDRWALLRGCTDVTGLDGALTAVPIEYT